MPSSFLVYLSGPIAGLTYSAGADWREYVSRCFPPHIEGVSPLRGHRMLENLGPITNAMIDHPLRTDRAINARDRFDTLRADAILVNFLGATKISIGTAMEIAWAYDHGIPVIGAMEPEGNPHDHPMVRDSLSARVASLDEAIETVTAFISPHEKHIWTRIEQNHLLQGENRLDLKQESLKENYGGNLRRQ